ncbi:MAG TPA: MFS transporter, partial [Anaeromyxobacteraceae bacterium]|nr:MFS transporter [Anaeromyxobacteraceae bacterium]
EPRTVDAAVARAGSVLRALRRHLWEMLKDLGRTVTSREGFTGLLICLAPVGCAALTNLFTGMAPDYGASARVVELVNGVGGGLAGAAGSLVGGLLADRMNRRLAYACAGAATAAAALAMFAGPLTPSTYAWGTLAYGFAAGIAFATWAGMVLELVGPSAATATKYALFNASSNLAISYVTWLDGRASTWPLPGAVPAQRSLLFDAMLTAGGISFLVAMVVLLRRYRPEAASEVVPARP